MLENTRGEAPLMPNTPVPLDLLSSGNSRPNKMSVCEASPSVTTEPEFTENLRWSELTTKILNLLAEGPPEQRARELAEYIHILRTEKGFATYFMRAVLDRIEMFIMRVKKTLYSVDEESRAELPLIYKDQWLAFESTLRFATEFGKLIGEKQVTDTLIALSVDCWDQSIIVAKDGVLVPHMIKVLCQKVFENKHDPKQVELVYEVARSFDNRALGNGNLVLAKTVFGCECRRLILEESYEHYVNESLTRCSCEETITKVAIWRQSIFETSVALPFLGEPTRAMDRIIASDLTIPLFKKLAQEVSAAYKLFSETHFSNEMPRVHIPVEPAFKMLWGLEYFDGQKELPEGLRLAEKNCLYLRSVCKETFGELTPSWVTQVALQIRSEIKRFPTDPGEQITDSAAFIDFYCDAWNSHCRYISYHLMLMSRIDMLHDLIYFSMIDWVEVVLDVERENIFRHLGAVFLDYLLGQIDVNPYHKHEEYLKLTLVLVSFKYAQSDDFEAFRIYSLGHVLRPLVDEVAKKLQRDVTPRDCPELILAWMARMDYIRKKLRFPKKFYEFNRLMIATYFEFILYQMGILVREKNAQAINDMCILINDYESWEPENIYGMIAAVCQQCGREEIQRIFEETKGSLPESVFSATQEFDLLVNRISNLRVKTAVLNGFRYAINKEAVSRGSSALELVVQYYLPAVGMTVAVHRRTDECLRRVTKYANAFKYFSNLAEFSELFVESLAERAMNVFAFSFMVENVIFELVRQYLNPNCAKRCRDQLDDLAKSVTRMQSLPSLAGFQRTTVETGLCKKSGIDENKSDKATKESRQSAAKQAKLDDLLKDGLAFDGIEFNVRVLHEKLWLMRPLEPEFSPPPSLKRIMKAFEETYKVEGKRRVLTWLPYYSRVEMLWRFTKDQRTYHVHIDSLTAAVMLLFEDLVDITFKDIQQSTKISSRRLKHLIDVLLKTNILVRKDNNDSQMFALNLDFRSWQREFILSVNYKEMENESKVDTASCSAEGDSMSEKAEKENDSVWRLSAVMARVAKHASKISKKALFERTIWELGNWGCRNPQQLHDALEHLVKHSYVEYEKTSKTFIYIP